MNHALRPLVFILTLLVLSVAPGAARTPQGRHITGTVQQVDFNGSRAVIIPGDSTKAVSFAWNRHTVFAAGENIVPATRLANGVRVEVILHSPFFGEPFATKVVFLDPALKN